MQLFIQIYTAQQNFVNTSLKEIACKLLQTIKILKTNLLLAILGKIRFVPCPNYHLVRFVRIARLISGILFIFLLIMTKWCKEQCSRENL